MAVRLRLSRIGKKHAPFYRIVAVDGRKKRDGAFLEDLGTYDGLKSILIRFENERMDYWLSQGAIPSDAVHRIQLLYKKSGVAGGGARMEPEAVEIPVKMEQKASKGVKVKETVTQDVAAQVEQA
ncbi:MAG TPA: 30S ribosomal protein S16 [Candidatus Babeliales bacterium]|nr:30S ribosomal protein S16 [Candidatus Babeliales bacterium]